MERNKLCQCCNQRHAARVHEEKGKNGSVWEYYCLDCYTRIFLDEIDGEDVLSVCPYCGMSASAIASSKLVGCAHCYQTLQSMVYPMVYKMQGKKGHKGKTPPLDTELCDLYDFENGMSAEYREKAVAQARYERQCRELEIIIKKLKAEGNFEDAKSYAEKLAAMKNRSAIEEDFVWRTRPNLSKQP